MEAFFGAVSSAWSREDGAALASALEGGDPTTAAAAAAARRAAGGAAGASGGGGWAAAAAARQCVPPSDAVAAAGAQVMVAEAEGDAHGVYEALNTALSYVSHAQHARRVSGETCCARRACVSRCQERTDADLCPCGAQTTTVAGTLAAGHSIGPRVGE